MGLGPLILLFGIQLIAGLRAETVPDSLYSSVFSLGSYDGFVATILGLVATVVSLFETVRLRQWDWFVVILLLNFVGTLIYTTLGPGKSVNR